ncbi:MAG TPA: ATP-dependent zinc protease [Methylocella sp.]|nr:ATP-dependent zinc protease [Methylocella sp.]
MEARPVQKEPLTIGWREWAALPELNVRAIKAKIDTGARTSALHAYRIEPFRRAGALWLRFELHPLQRSDAMTVACEAPAIDERMVKNSGGGTERRYVIRTLLKLGDEAWPIELALANRDQMGFRMLLGRTALEGRALIEPGRSYLLGGRTASTTRGSKPRPHKIGRLLR